MKAIGKSVQESDDDTNSCYCPILFSSVAKGLSPEYQEYDSYRGVVIVVSQMEHLECELPQLCYCYVKS